MAGVLFEDIFNVKDIDPEGKKFDRGESETLFTPLCIRKQCCKGMVPVDAIFLSAQSETFCGRSSVAEVAGKHMV